MSSGLGASQSPQPVGLIPVNIFHLKHRFFCFCLFECMRLFTLTLALEVSPAFRHEARLCLEHVSFRCHGL